MPGSDGDVIPISTDDMAPPTTHTIYRKSSPTKLLPFLYLGSLDDAAHFSVLQDIGITHLLNCAASRDGPQHSPFVRFGGNTGILAHEGFMADDTESYTILDHLPAATEFINTARDEDRKVLVYCVKGINRSSAICVGYLMAEYKITLVEALDLVGSKRGTILTNPGFRQQLKAFSLITK